MTRQLILVAALLAASVVSAPAGLTGEEEHDRQLAVHEWGTFTAVAGEDGRPVRWLPLDGPADLPCFVERTRNLPPKAGLWATVRMETPVLYFYAPWETTIDVDVRFPLGLITEYFPTADVSGGRIAWTGIKVQPEARVDFPVEEEPSHYYAARDTNAAPVEVDGQRERFLFYRGVGSFPLPVSATVAGDRITVTNLGRDPIDDVVLFENRGGHVGYRIGGVARGAATFERPGRGADLAALRADLTRILMSHGLFPKEAAAMVETWRDSWFEEGTRLFYVMPQRAVDAILPLRMNPRPADIARVFIGRLELIAPEMLEEVDEAIHAGNLAGLQKYGRFLQPIGDRLASRWPPSERASIEPRLRQASSAFDAGPLSCAP